MVNESWKVGRVKFFNLDSGYGFINCLEDGRDYFVHISGVVSKPIQESDYVVFKLELSRKKPNTLEARRVYLLLLFKEDVPYLCDVFLKYQPKRQLRFLDESWLTEEPNDSIRKTILQNLSEPQILDLLETEVAGLQSIENDTDFLNALKLLCQYCSVTTENAQVNRISKRVSTWIEKNASGRYLVKFWMRDVLPNQPDQYLLEDYLENTDRKGRALVFEKSADAFRTELTTKYIFQNKHTDLLDLVLDSIKIKNGIRLTVDIKSKLFDKNYWVDKEGIELYQLISQKVADVSDDDRTFELFVKGYINEFSTDYVLSNITEIERDSMERVLETGQLSQSDYVKVFDSYFSRLQRSYWGITPKPNSSNDPTIALQPNFRDVHDLIEPISWTVAWAAKCMDTIQYEQMETELIKDYPDWLVIQLWEKGAITQKPLRQLSNLLLATQDLQPTVESWLNGNRIQPAEIIELTHQNLVEFFEITERRKCSVLFGHLNLLRFLEYDISSLGQIVPEPNRIFIRLFLWLEGLSNEFNFEDFRAKVVFLTPDNQIKFLKKLFWLAHTNQFDLSVDKLDQLTRIDFDIYENNKRENPDVHLDISVDIVIETIKTYDRHRRFLAGGEILKAVLRNLTSDKKKRFKIEHLFEKCRGRYEPEFIWNTFGQIKKVPFNQGNFYFSIEFEHDAELNELVSQIPGSRWNDTEGHWGVPKQYEDEVLAFGRDNRFFFDFDGSNYSNNTHLALFHRQEIPYGISYCEGRKANISHRTFDREFWMCANQACFQNCESIHESDDWINYTLLDFMVIMGFDLDETNRVGDDIAEGTYYKFVSAVNWFNLLSERLYCEGCQQVLHPVDPAHFARHFVVRFHCQNPECTECGKEIYLNQCLNGKRKGIVDSRKSKKCSNGMYICSDKNCGCCCSHKKFDERLNRLKEADDANTSFKRRIIADLTNKVENRLGHLERAMHYCYQCGSLMKSLPNDVFKCLKCNLKYDVSDNRFERPHMHI